MATSTITPSIAPPIRTVYYDAVDKTPRSPRKNATYPTEVIDVLNKYKNEYRKITTTEERHQLLRNFILVDVFNFWFHKGEVVEDISEHDLSGRIKVRIRYSGQ